MKDLGEIDVKILKELLKDGRKSFTTIAEECHTSKDIIWKHYKEMTKVGIIVGATIQFNYQKFCYTGVALITLSVDSQYINDVFCRLKKIPNSDSFRFCITTPNIATISQLKSLKDLERVKEIMSKEQAINEIKTHIWTDVRNMPENILAGLFENNAKNPNAGILASGDAQASSVKIDDLDMQIVEKLTKNGRLPFSKIAQEIGRSTGIIIRRYEKLKKNNFIKVSIQINPVKLGYTAILNIDLALAHQNETKDTVERLSKIPGVVHIVKMSGNYDIAFTAFVKDCKDIFVIDEEIVKIPGIKKTEIKVSLACPIWPTPRQYISTF